jgi:hypothetical protein
MARKSYEIMEVLATSIAVDEAQGFIKSGHGYYDYENKCNVFDNKTAIRYIINDVKEAEDIDVTVTSKHMEKAEELKTYFDSVIVMKKLTGNFNGFEDTVGNILNKKEVDNYGISVLASLPNSMRIQKQRDDMDDFYEDMRQSSEYVGKVGSRGAFSLFIKDVKYIAKYGIHLVTAVESDQNLIKFFWSKDPDISDLIVGKSMRVTGFVKEQSISKFSNCKETVLNRVKIEKSEKKG